MSNCILNYFYLRIIICLHTVLYYSYTICIFDDLCTITSIKVPWYLVWFTCLTAFQFLMGYLKAKFD